MRLELLRRPFEIATTSGLAFSRLHGCGARFEARSEADTGEVAEKNMVDEFHDLSNSWFALRTRYRHEHLVRDQLSAKQIEVFLPTVTRWSRWKDRDKRIQWPLFEGYCFARFEPACRLRVLNCFGVIDIVSFNRVPAPIPNEEIQSIRRIIASGLEYDQHPFLREGEPARVVRGPLLGVVGRLVRKGARARLILSVELVHAAVSVEVDAADVSAA
jgi:transcription termination/antitermination protein NusG